MLELEHFLSPTFLHTVMQLVHVVCKKRTASSICEVVPPSELSNSIPKEGNGRHTYYSI